MNCVDHGGECCGVSLIYNFLDWSADEEDRVKRLMDDQLREWEGQVTYLANGRSYDTRKPSHLFEIVLTDNQLRFRDNAWVAALKRLGFRHVARWYNSNSENYCNMFVWYRKARRKAPWKV